MEQQGQGQGNYQYYRNYPSPSPSQESSSFNVPPLPPTFGTPVSSTDLTGGSTVPSLHHAHSDPSALLPPPAFHSHAHHGHAHGPHQPNAGEYHFAFGFFGY